MRLRSLLVAALLLGTAAAVAVTVVVLSGEPEAPTTRSESQSAEADDAIAADDPVSTRRRVGPERMRVDEVVEVPSDIEEARRVLESPVLELESLVVAPGERRALPPGTVRVTGDIRVTGELVADRTTLLLDGGDQALAGRVTARGMILRNGAKRLSGYFGTANRDPAAVGAAELVVAAGASLVVEEGGVWTTPNAYGFQVAGDLVVDGGTFMCRFTNGDGKERGSRSWLPGSTLTIYSGKFQGRGDADFRDAIVTLHAGSLEIDDDLWHTGKELRVYGGLVRNSKSGGAFGIGELLDLRAGEIRVHQSGRRGLRISEASRVICSGGLVTIGGRAASTDEGGILLQRSATFFDVAILVDTHIRSDSDAAAYLEVTNELAIAKERRLRRNGRSVISRFVPSGESGTIVD